MSATVAAEHVAALGTRIDAALEPLLERGEPVALIDFPSYPNVGDNAIWLGELAWLARHGHPVDYVATHRDYSRQAARRRIGEATILLSGGGNLGDLYPWHQHLRERVLADFPKNRVVQLPQSITFRGEAAQARAARALAAHPDLTVMARDRRSLAVAGEQLGCRAILCPDMAYALGPLGRPRPADRDLLALLRADRHSTVAAGAFGGLATFDWSAARGPETGRALLATIKPLEIASGRLPALGRPAAPLLARLYRRHARLRVDAGLALLSRARAVITDRLHGHILCTLLGIPSVLIDERNGKLGGFYEAWLERLEICEMASTPEQATVAARRLAERVP